MQHLEEGTIHAWLDGALPEAEAREVERHIATCAECSAMAAEARGLIAGASRIVSSLDVVRGNVIPKAPAARGGRSLWHSLHLTPARAALAATLMIAISSVLTLRHDTPAKLIPPATQPAPASTADKVQAAAAAPSAPAKAKTVSAAEPVRVTPDSSVPRTTLAMRAKDRMTTNGPARDLAAAPPSAPPVQPPAAAGASAKNATETSEKKELAKASPLVEQPRREGQMQAQMRVTAMDQIAVTGEAPACFELAPGMEVSPLMPRRFALQNLPGDTTKHVVRAVDETGRLDTLLTGSTWTRATPTEVTVRFATNERTVTLPIRDAAARGAASAVMERNNFASQRVPSVTRVTCRP